MSIAISVVVKPSRRLRFLTAGMSLLLLVIGTLIVSDVIGDLSFVVRIAAAIFSFFPALFGFYHIAQKGKVLHIDISSIGQIRLREIDDVIPRESSKRPYENLVGEVFNLSRDSTIWPYLMVLCLQNGSEEKMVPILPDCVSRDEFRALSVACRWIAAQNSRAEHKNS
jgi:hypothetical protein